VLDYQRIDGELMRARDAWARACGALDRGEHANDPLDVSLLHEERVAELAELDDPCARALATWALVLLDERRGFDDRAALGRLWHAPHDVDHLDAPVGLAALRAQLLSDRSSRGRALSGAALRDLAQPLSDRAIAALERRFERERAVPFGAVQGLAPATVASLAERVLARSDELSETMRRGWIEGLHATIGAGADDGWPARLTARWVGAVVATSALTAGLRLRAPTLPRAWGAMSFARALGAFGVAVLEAGRPAGLLAALHQRPAGTRRHRRRALFSSLVVERSFARRVLSLGSERARTHGRAASAALIASLRIDALRVLLGSALRSGKAALIERHVELTERLFGAPAPAATALVLPRARPADGAALIGALEAVAERDRLVALHDDDWFANPRAMALLRDADTRPLDDAPPDADALSAAIDRLVDRVEQSLS
jgi:hypothetical protein